MAETVKLENLVVETCSYAGSAWSVGGLRSGVSGSSNYRSKVTIPIGAIKLGKSEKLVVSVTVNATSSPSGTYAVLHSDGGFTPAQVVSDSTTGGNYHMPSDELLADCISESYPYEDADGVTILTGNNMASGFTYYYVFNTDALKPNTTYYMYVMRNIYSGCGTTSGWTSASGEKVTATLTMVAGASAITGASNVTLGNACAVTWTPLADSFGYRLRFGLGEWSHTTDMIHPNTTASYTYNGYILPLEVAEQITDSPKGIMTAALYTYLESGEPVGEADTEEFTVTVPDNEETKPAVDMGLSIVSELSAPFDSLYIQNLTKVGADISATGRYGASIADCRLTVGSSVCGEPFVLTQTGDVTVTAKATDSRGYVGQAQQTIYVIPYDKPAIVPADGETDIVCVRCDGNGYITDSGTWLRIRARRRYSPVISNGEQLNHCRFRYRCNGGEWVTIPSEEDEIDVTIPDVVSSPLVAYTVEVGVEDDLGFGSGAVIIVPSDQVEFHLRHGGEGAAFGEYAEDARVLAVAESWQLKVKGSATVGGALTVREPQSDAEALNRGAADARYLKQEDRVDYIVETGTTNGWSWRKWNSGTAECWGVFVGSSSHYSDYGAAYGYLHSIVLNFPFDFAANPAVQVACQCGNGIGVQCRVVLYTYQFTTVLDSNLPDMNYTLSVCAKGRWK